MAVAISGFEITKQQLNEEHSIGRVQPRFVAVVETRAWNWQAKSFAENQLGEFINSAYGGGVELEVSDKKDGKYYVWSAEDGRKAYGLVRGSLVFFGNDESAIDRCLAVGRGEADAIGKNPKISGPEAGVLASGYISPDGVAQLSNIAGLSIATTSGDDSEVKSFIARVLPELLRKSITEVTWRAVKSGDGIEDTLTVALEPELANTFSETMRSGDNIEVTRLEELVPADSPVVTRYLIKDARIAWRSLLLAAEKQTDAVSGKLIVAFSGSLFEPYGIEEPEVFLTSVKTPIVTTKVERDGDDVVVIATVTDTEKVRRSIAKEIDFAKPPEKIGEANVWKSENGEFATAFVADTLVLGDAQGVLKCLRARETGENFANSNGRRNLNISGASAVTRSIDADPAAMLVEVLGDRKEGATLIQRSLTATSYDKAGLKRIAVSDFGFLGSIIEQFAQEGEGGR